VSTQRKAIERALSKVPDHPDPDPELEQYTTPAGLATDLLFEAYHLDDLGGQFVLDLGCGTGMLGIGASLMGAMPVYGFDIDEQAIDVAREAAQRAGASQATFEAMPVQEMIEFEGDTILCNPPFGAQNRHADRPFLEVAARTGDVCYTFHLTETMDWVTQRIRDLDGEPTHQFEFRFPIEAQFPFHEDPTRDVHVTVVRWETGTPDGPPSF
jgi:putative methylase